jgi:hypothetical protein
MAVHDLRAEPLVVDTSGWQPMDTFPHDGTIVEVLWENSQNVTRAQWREEQIFVEHLAGDVANSVKAWRTI